MEQTSENFGPSGCFSRYPLSIPRGLSTGTIFGVWLIPRSGLHYNGVSYISMLVPYEEMISADKARCLFTRLVGSAAGV